MAREWKPREARATPPPVEPHPGRYVQAILGTIKRQFPRYAGWARRMIDFDFDPTVVAYQCLRHCPAALAENFLTGVMRRLRWEGKDTGWGKEELLHDVGIDAYGAQPESVWV